MNHEEQLVLPDATPEILHQVKQQIEKDLALCGFSFAEEDYNNLPAMVPELHEKIIWLKENASRDIMKIVYRVDLTEKQYARLSAMPGDWSENFAKAIVLREFQKILIRKNLM